VLKFVAIVCLAVLGSAPVMSAAQDVEARTALRSSPSERYPSLVLTPQGVERLAPPARSETGLSVRSELGSPGWSRAQSLALSLTTTIACAVMGSACAPMLPTPMPATPPGSELWQLAGCKTPATCGWLWGPAIGGPYFSPQQ